MSTCTFYDPESGMITGELVCSESSFPLNTEGKSWVSGLYKGDLYYVSNGEAVQRPSMDISVEGSVIAGIHEGSTITLGGQSFQVDDGEADIEGYSGVVQITCWPYIDEEVEI